MIEPFLIAGGLLFWLLTGIFFLLAICFTSFDRSGKATLTIVGYIALITLFSNADPLAFIKANWLAILYATLAYLATGTVFMIVRWRLFFIPQVSAIYDDIRNAFIERKQIQGEIVSKADKNELLGQVECDYRMRKLNAKVPLLVRENKARLTNWMAFWPFSLASFVLGDLIVQIVNRIVRTFSGMMQRMSDRAFSKYSELN